MTARKDEWHHPTKLTLPTIPLTQWKIVEHFSHLGEDSAVSASSALGWLGLLLQLYSVSLALGLINLLLQPLVPTVLMPSHLLICVTDLWHIPLATARCMCHVGSVRPCGREWNVRGQSAPYVALNFALIMVAGNESLQGTKTRKERLYK